MNNNKLVAIVFMMFLFVSELSSFLRVEVKSDMFVETPGHATMSEEWFDVLFSITIPHMPCAIIGVDIQDAMGRHEIGGDQLLRKRRYAENGTQLDMHNPQDHGGNLAAQLQEQQGEHCNVHGHLKLGKIPGNFHLSTHAAQQRVHIDTSTVNFAHIIEHMNFGENLGENFDIPGAFTPLNGREVLGDVPGVSYEYYFKIVPTIYETLSGDVRTSYQFVYAYKEHKDEHAGHGHGAPPSALYFKYDLSPITVRYTETRKSFLSFLTNVCAIIGGVFTVAGIVDAFVYHGAKLIMKDNIGKLS